MTSESSRQCRLVDVDGETIRVQGGRAMTDHEKTLFAEIVRAVKRRWATDHDADEAGHPTS